MQQTNHVKINIDKMLQLIVFSIIVSTNLAFSEWLTMFENQTMVAAMIDRLTYRSFVLNMNSEHPYRAEHTAKSNEPFKL